MIILPDKKVEVHIPRVIDKQEIITRLITVGLQPDKRQIIEVIDARWFMGKSSNASKISCAIWIHTPEEYLVGYGQAGGWGYCKQSAAADAALRSLGATGFDCSGQGMSIVREVFRDIGKTLGYDELLIVGN